MKEVCGNSDWATRGMKNESPGAFDGVIMSRQQAVFPAAASVPNPSGDVEGASSVITAQEVLVAGV